MSKMYPITNGKCEVNNKVNFELEGSYSTTTEKYTETSVNYI